MTMRKILGIALFASFIAAFGGAQEGKPQAPQGRMFDQEAGKLLDDKAQPWWNNHRPPKATKPQSYNMSPSDDLGGRVDPPIYVSQMPIEVGAWIHSGGRPAEGHPLSGRALVLLDVRRRSEWLAERIPGKELDASLESGALSKLDLKSILVVFGSKWAHYEVTSRLRSHKFEALYAMEGLEAWKAKCAQVDRDEKLAQFLKETEAERKASLPPPPPVEMEPLPGMDPKALKRLLDAGVDLLCVFVGDRLTYEDGHVPGAHHVPVAQLEKWFADVDKNQLIMVMCGCCMGKRGGPSENGMFILEKLGFTRVLHLDGHMNAWKIAGLPIQTEDPPPRKKR
jgi:rhodanese-related sulfurtransferase